MSLEQALQENTEALRALTALLSNGAAIPLTKHDFGTGVGVESAKQPTVPVNRNTDTIALKLPDAPEGVEFEATVTAGTPKTETPAPFKLPAGERDQKYYEKHILPVVKDLAITVINGAAVGRDALQALLKDDFGAPKASEIPADRWEELVTKVKAKTAELKGG